VEIDTQREMEIIFRAFKEGVTQLSDKPIDVGTDVRFASRAGVPMMFKPGTTSFLAVADMTTEYINVLLGNNARPEAGRRTRVVDDEAGDIPALQMWIDNGYLAKAPRVPMFIFETRLAYSMHHSLAVMTHNIHLCATAMGLGVYLHSGYNHIMLMGATPVMKGLGFRVLSDKRGIPNPVGIDGVIHAHHPPDLSVEEAVDDVWDMKYKPGYGRFSSTVREGDEVLYRGFSTKPRAVHRPYKNVGAFFDAIGDFKCPETVQIAKDILSYFIDKYGRFPKYYDAMHFGPICQTAHMDIDFYDEYYLPDAVTQEARDHLRIWHR
jgi:hypothetical protein